MTQKRQKVLILVADIYEDLELQYPKYRLIEAGKEVVVAGEKKNTTYKGKYGYPCESDIDFNSVNVSDYEALIIPGGYAPDKLRRDPKVLEITKHFYEQNKVVAFICHAGWVPISAKILKGVKCTSFFAIKDDLVNAGAEWVDEAVVVHKNVISSRTPEDLPVFCQEIIEKLL